MASSPTPPAFLHLAAHPLRWRLLTELSTGDLRVRDLSALLGEPQNLVSYHLRLLRDGGLVSANRSSHDGRDSWYHLDLDRCAAGLAGTGAALHPSLGPPDSPGPLGPGSPAGAAGPAPAGRPRRVGVLFLCTGNSARSPIAEALLRHRAGRRVTAAGAGTRPRPELHPDAVRVLREDFGIDASRRRPRSVDALAHRRFDWVVSLCDRARETAPEFPGDPRRVHWSIPDPAAGDAGYAAFRRTAAELDARIGRLLPLLATAPTTAPATAPTDA